MEEWMPLIMYVVVLLMIVMVVRMILESSGFLEFLKKKARFREKERNILEKLYRDIRRGAKVSKPVQLKYLFFEGDKEHPAKYVGKIKGFAGHKDVNHIVIKSSMLSSAKVLLCHEDLHSDVFSRHLYVKARGMEPIATYFWVPVYNVQVTDFFRRWNEISTHLQILIERALSIWVPEEMAKQVIVGMRPSERIVEMITRPETPAYEKVEEVEGTVVE